MNRHHRPSFVRISWVATLALALALLSRPALAAPNILFDDPRFTQWSRDWLAGRGKDVLQSVEQDLKSASPHPLAPKMWCEIQQSLTHTRPAGGSRQGRSRGRPRPR